MAIPLKKIIDDPGILEQILSFEKAEQERQLKTPLPKRIDYYEELGRHIEQYPIHTPGLRR